MQTLNQKAFPFDGYRKLAQFYSAEPVKAKYHFTEAALTCFIQCIVDESATTEQSGEAVQLVCDALIAIVAHSSNPDGMVEMLKPWRARAEEFTRNYGKVQPAPVVPDGLAAKATRLADWCDENRNAVSGSQRNKLKEISDCLRALRALLAAAPQPAQQLPPVIEEIAQQWDGCIYDAEGSGLLDIGQSIRDAGKRLMAVPQSSPLAAADGVDALLASAMADVSGHESLAYEKLRKARTMLAAPQPEQVEQQAPGKWQPISTAPQNGMHILCYMETEFGGHMEPMYWSDGCWTYCLDGDSCQYTPSHWMPSPPAPTQESGTRMTAEAKGGEA
ncbi:hypothetical protein BUE93_21320 [Chromobacterium amazonense]|uniref:DUF551 domain-containing protein n=1 Tax=Chromobacterium amazonense TaxID=1382803 RepID=A0A2S9WYT9_9NEIS|nr:hypothetical protein [Chromobacterium amazonense]PRP68632.1 hypothetical protein BUE93_21320 [Chromobacterium amazonense]